MRTGPTILKYTKLLKTTQLEATEFCTKLWQKIQIFDILFHIQNTSHKYHLKPETFFTQIVSMELEMLPI